MIRIENLSLTYRSAGVEHHAVRGVSITLEQAQFYTLLGPSGCGKTTTLRCVAGLERPDEGEIVVGGEVVFSASKNVWVPPNERNIGMVFQSYAIWPHMSVADNVAFPLIHARPRPSADRIRERVRAALALVKLDGLEDRPAPFLSGGQQQRLALARALVGEPKVLLLDEPLSNLDAKLREEMRFELADLVKRLNVTTLFVTHEQIEALTMSDVMGVMSDGLIVQEGSPQQIYAAPGGSFVADFIGKTNFFEGSVEALGGSADEATSATIATPLGRLECRIPGGAAVGDAVKVAVRPENVALCPPGAAMDGNATEGEVETITFLGNMLDCVVRAGDLRIHVQLHPAAPPATGSRVGLHLPAEHVLAMRS